MELQAYDPVRVKEPLVAASLRAPQGYRTPGQIESIPVPMEGGESRWKYRTQPCRTRFRLQVHRKPADFRFMVAAYLRAEHVGQQLRPQAYSQHGRAAPKSPFQGALLVAQPREAVLVMHSHGTPHGDNPIRPVRSGKEFLPGIGLPIGNPMAPGFHPGAHGAQAFEGDM